VKKYYLAIGLICAIVAATIIGYYVVGSGSRADQDTVGDLQAIRDRIHSYVGTNDRLPASMAQLNLPTGVKGRAQRYQYHVTSSSEFELCANFKQASRSSVYSSTEDLPANSFLPGTHKAGHQCFKQTEQVMSSSELRAEGSASEQSSAVPAATTVCATAYTGVTAFDGSIKIIDLQGGQIQVTKASTTNYFYWQNEPQVVDANCNALALSQLHAGDKVTVYARQGARTAYIIQRQ
jgi:hypothetical protein